MDQFITLIFHPQKHLAQVVLPVYAQTRRLLTAMPASSAGNRLAAAEMQLVLMPEVWRADG